MEKMKIEVCVGTACYLLGAHDLMEAVERLPQDIKANIELSGIVCLKGCGKGPNVRVNGEMFNGMTPNRLLDIIYDKLTKSDL